ncbi:MAG TPA: hypothetical protein VJP60_04060 [Rhizomicrobium sp.]|nr:hypothetical protein [Rhizomicrobium sp.]
MQYFPRVEIGADPTVRETGNLGRHRIADPKPTLESARDRLQAAGEALGCRLMEETLTAKPLGARAYAKACGKIKQGRAPLGVLQVGHRR